MTHLHFNLEFHFVQVFARWLQTRYVHKLERYAASHGSSWIIQ